MPAKIGIILAVDGEREFREAMSNATTAAAAMKAQIKEVTQEYANNANSLEALQAKEKALKSAQEALGRATAAAKDGQANAQKAVDKYTSAIEKQDTKISEAKRELERLKKTYGEGSAEVKKQEKYLDELNSEQDENKRKLQAAENGLNKWKKKVSDATTAELKNSQALDKNSKYLDEAENSADHCAKSIDRFGKEMKDSGKAADEAGRSWEEAFKIAAAGKAMDLAGSAVGALKDALVNGAKAAVEVGSNFESSMSNVAALSGATGTVLDQLSVKAQELGRTTKFSASEAADAFGYMALAGWDTQQMLDGVDGVMQLAAASGMDLASASDMVTDYLSAFNMEASEASKMADMLAYAQAHSNTTAEQLGEAYGNCAAGLNTAGQSIDTVTAMLEAMANQGTKGSEAGTALNAIMSQITQKMEDGAIQIGDTAVAVQDSEGNFRDLTDILADVEAATDGMGTAQKSAALAGVFNRTALSGLNQILNEGVDKVKGYRDELNNSAGSAQAMADTMNNNLQGAITEAGSAAEGLGIAIFDQVAGPMTTAVRTATDIINKITDAITPQKSALEQFIDEIEQGNERVRALIDNASNTANSADIYATKLDGYKEVLLEVAGATEQTEFQKYQVAQIVRELGGQIPELAAAWDEESKSLNMNREEIIKLMDTYKSSMIMKAYTDALTDSYSALADATLHEMQAQDAYNTAHEKTQQAIENSIGSVETLGNQYYKVNKSVAELTDEENQAKQVLEEATQARTDAESSVESYEALLDELKKKYPELADELDKYSEATNNASNNTDNLKEKTGEMADVEDEATKKVREAFENMQKSIGDAVKSSISFFEEFNGGSEVNLKTVIENLESQVKGLDNWKSNMERLAGEAGSGMTQEFYDYLVQMGPKSANLVDELVKSLDKGDGKFEKVVEDWTKAMELSDTSQILATYTTAGEEFAKQTGAGWEGGIASVSGQITESAETVGKDAGNALILGGTESIEAGAGEIANAAENVFTGARTTIEGMSANYTSTGQLLMQGVASGMTAESGTVSQASEGVATAANSSASNTAAQFTASGQALAAALGTGISNNKAAVTSAADAVAREAAEAASNKSGNFNSAGRGLSSALGSGIKGNQSVATSAAAVVAAAAAGKAYGYQSSFKSAGKSMSSGLASGIRSGKSSAINAAVEVAAAALAAAKKKLGINSPSKEFEKVGVQINQGWAAGITSSQSLVADALTGSKKLIDKNNKDARILMKRFKNDFGAKKTDDKGKKNKNYYSDYLRGAEKALEQYQVMRDMSMEEELKYWEEVQKHLKRRSDEWYDVQKKIKDLNTDIAEEKKAKKEEEREKKREEREKRKEEKAKQREEAQKQREEEAAKRQELYDNQRRRREEAYEKLQTKRDNQDKILDNWKIYHDMSLKAEAQYWNKARKQFKEGTALRIEADQKYFEAQKAWKDKRAELKQEELEQEQEINSRLASEIEDLTKTYEDAVEERKSSILSSMSLFEDWDSTGYTADILKRNLQHQVEGLKLWEAEMKSLRKKALPEEFVKELEDMGPDATASIWSLNRMTAGELDEYVKLWKEKGEIATKEAKRQNKDLLAETKTEIAERKSTAKSEIKALREQLKADLAEVSTDIDKSLLTILKKSGSLTEQTLAAMIAEINDPKPKNELRKGSIALSLSITGGMSDGMKTSLPSVKTTAADTVDKTLGAMKKKVSDHAASKENIGTSIATSIAAGMTRNTSVVADSARQMIIAAMTAANAQVDAEWSNRSMAGIRSINNLISPVGVSSQAVTRDPTQANMERLLRQVTLISEQLARTQLVVDTGALVGAIQPAMSTQQAAVTIRRNRGML